MHLWSLSVIAIVIRWMTTSRCRTHDGGPPAPMALLEVSEPEGGPPAPMELLDDPVVAEGGPPAPMAVLPTATRVLGGEPPEDDISEGGPPAMEPTVTWCWTAAWFFF